jgi:hypothetical protein
VRDAYQRKGVLAVEPNYFDYCRHFSGDQRFVLCGLQNPYGSCPDWTSAASLAASTTPTATSALDVDALFGLATPEPEIPEQFRPLAEDFIDFAGCILGITLTDAQMAALRRELAPVFTSPSGPAARAVDAAVASFQPARNADVQSRHGWRQRNQLAYLQQLRGSDEPLSRMLLQWHVDATQVLAAGTPPLAREAAESWVELIAFASTARSGRNQSATLPADVETRIAHLAGDYPRLSARQRSMIALAPITLYELRRAWPAMSAAQREAAESQLETQLGVTLPPAPAATVTSPPPAAPPPQTRPPQTDETPLSRLTREFAEAQVRGDHQTAAKLQMQIQIELQNQTARLEMESSVAKMYHEMSMSIINNMK